MLFVSAEDFFKKAEQARRLSREEEKALALAMKQGDKSAERELVNSYLRTVAAHIRRAPTDLQTLNTVYVCIDALEKAVRKFNFLQDGEPFSHRLAWCMRQCITRCIANRN